jgi:hypothetical protein
VRAEEPLPSVRALFLPSPWSVALVTVTAVWLVLGGGCTTVVFQGSGLTSLFLGVFVLPAGAALAFLAALVSRTASARAVLHGSTALLLALGAFLVAVSNFDRGFDVGSILVSILLYAIPIAVVGTLAVFFGGRSARELEERLAARRVERLRRALLERGAASFDELAAASGIPDTEVDDALDRLHGEGQLVVVLDAPARRAFTQEGFAAQEEALVRWVYERGRMAIYDLARQLGMSEARLRELLYAALSHGRFAGYVDWRRGIVFSIDARRLREGRVCPNCGGAMDLAGSGVIACPYCETEVLLA